MHHEQAVQLLVHVLSRTVVQIEPYMVPSGVCVALHGRQCTVPAGCAGGCQPRVHKALTTVLLVLTLPHCRSGLELGLVRLCAVCNIRHCYNTGTAKFWWRQPEASSWPSHWVLLT
jgi:hypothetical protein